MTKNSSNTKRPARSLRRLLLGATVLASVGFVGAKAQADTFADALVMAIQNNPAYDVAVAQVQGLDENVSQARAGQRPTVLGTAAVNVDATAATDPTVVNGVQSDSTDVDVPATLGVRVTQNIYDGGRTSNAVDEAYASVRSGRASLTATEQTVLLEAVRAYVDVLEAQENLTLAQNNVRVIGRELEAAEDRFEVGEVTRTDVSQARARLAEARAGMSSAMGALGTAKQAYIRAVGAPADSLAPLPPLPELPATLEEAQAIAERMHPSVRAAREAVSAASFNVREQLGGLLPTVDLTGDLSAASDIDANDGSTFGAGVGVEGAWSIFQGGALRSQVRQADALADQRRAELFDTARLVLEAVGTAWENLNTARATIAANREQIKAAEVAFAGVQEEAKVGSRTTLDVLDAETELLDARVGLVNSESDEYTAAYELLSSIGLLTVNHLGLDVAVYNPEPNYQAAQRLEAGYEETEDTDWRYNFQP